MATFTARVYQAQTDAVDNREYLNSTQTFNLHDLPKPRPGRTKLGQVVGTIVNETIKRAQFYKNCGSRLFDGRQPILLDVEVNGKRFDLGTMDDKLQKKLLLRLNDEGKQRFATRTWMMIEEILREVEVVEIEDLIKKA